MKTQWGPLLGFVLALVANGHAAEFRNLDFEDADTTRFSMPEPTGVGAVTKLLPGWNLSKGHEIRLAMGINFYPEFERDYPTLIGRLHPAPVFPIYDQDFGLQLRLVRDSNGQPWRLEQTATVPTGTIYMAYRKVGDEMQVWMDSKQLQPIPGVTNIADANPDGYKNVIPNRVYDVSEFAGREVKLQFIGPFGEFDWQPSTCTIDHIVFHDGIARIATIERLPKCCLTTGTLTQLTFVPVPLKDNFVEYADQLASGVVWKELPGNPRNTGFTYDINTEGQPQRYYRLRVEDPVENP